MFSLSRLSPFSAAGLQRSVWEGSGGLEYAGKWKRAEETVEQKTSPNGGE